MCLTTVIDPLTLLIKHKFAQDDQDYRGALFEHGEYFIHANNTLSVYNKADYSNHIVKKTLKWDNGEDYDYYIKSIVGFDDNNIVIVGG